MLEKTKEQSFWEKAKRFFEPLKENKIYTLTVLIEFFLWSFLWLLAVFFIRDITAILEYGEWNDFSFLLKKYLFLFISLMLGSQVMRNYGWVRFLENLRRTLFKKYLPVFVKLDNTETEKQWTWKINHLLQQWVNAHSIMLNDVLYNIAKISPFLIFTLYFVFKIYFFLWIAFIMLYVFLTFYTKFFDDKQVRIRHNKHIMKKDISRIVAKTIMSKFEILQNSKINQDVDKISDIFDRMIENNRQQNFWGHILFRWTETILFISKIVLLYFIWQQYLSWELSLTYVVTFITVLLYFEKNAQDFLIFYKNFTRDIHEMTWLWDFFDTTPQIEGYEEWNTFVHKNGDISLKNISYGYDTNKPVFKNFSIDVPWSQITALVGPSGWGKSTLVKLIAWYIRPDSGEVIIDKQKLSKTSLKSYYSDIGYLTQEPSVFDGTVRENLLYAVSQDIPESNIKKIISLAHCEFIYELPDGLDTEIGERGVKLSWGQKQRLAIAKIFLKDPKIIILDEPTSALDSISEKKITEAMHNLFKNRTVLVIAHRLQTVKHADDIIVIQVGEIIERGRHKELIRNKGFYKEMLDLQSGF